MIGIIVAMEATHMPSPEWTPSTMHQVATEPSLSMAAARYASMGIAVFPCLPGGKEPLTRNGFKDATTATHTIQAWWQRAPEANIGLPTGAGNGVVVVDVDRHASGSGFAAFERARAEGLAECWGWLVRTPSGGLHAYYLATHGREQRSWQVPSAHVDFRGEGGYIIAPPSRLPLDGGMKAYEVIAVSPRPLGPIDAVRLRRFLEPSRPRPTAPPFSIPTKGCHPEALARTVALTPEGGRNRALFWASCRMAENGQSRDSTLSCLMPAAQYAGLCDREIETTVDSAYRITSRLGPSLGPSRGSAQGPSQHSVDGSYLAQRTQGVEL